MMLTTTVKGHTVTADLCRDDIVRARPGRPRRVPGVREVDQPGSGS